MKLNEKAVAEALYEDPNIRTRIASHYGIDDVADDPVTFVDEVVEKLNQSPSPDPLRGVSNTEVFEASVRALGSNSRPWATFLKNEKRIYEALGGLNLAVARHTDPTQLATLLSGTTRKRDAAAITGWAKHLADLDDEQENYYDTVRELATRMKGDAATAGITDLPNEHLMLCLIGHLVDEQPKSWEGPPAEKLKGMRFALGSEFFRNLGWNGFKPDRHIIRLLDHWAPELVEEQRPVVDRLIPLTGRRSAEIHRMMRYSLAGIAISPSDDYSRTDNLIWLLGAYVETKRKREPASAGRYVTASPTSRLASVGS
ncbi:hypothetical protein [Millisia brevis]|uniref:hypothetical protein n=1 Tax=Millisia brevis TaxID=264148 RepID=UPI0012ED1222|nr:hypothetical protein [Millisia brevis]